MFATVDSLGPKMTPTDCHYDTKAGIKWCTSGKMPNALWCKSEVHDSRYSVSISTAQVLMASFASLLVALVLATGTAKVPDATCLVQAKPQLSDRKIQTVQIDPVPAPDGYELKCSKCVCLVPSSTSWGLSISQCANNCGGAFAYTTATSMSVCGCCGNTQVMDEPNDPYSVYVPKR